MWKYICNTFKNGLFSPHDLSASCHFCLLFATFYLKPEQFLLLPWKEWQGCNVCPHVDRALSNFFILTFLGFFSRGLSKWAINFNKAKPCCVKKLALTHKYTHTGPWCLSLLNGVTLISSFCHHMQMKCSCGCISIGKLVFEWSQREK